MPAAPLFSGWNCVADSGPFSTAARNGAVVAPRRHGRAERPHRLERPVLRAVGVHEVEPLVLDALEQIEPSPAHRVPAHVREHGRIEFGDRAGPLAEPVGFDAALHAVLEQHLHADADAEHRETARQSPLDELVAADAAKRAHDGAEGPDAGTTRPSASATGRDQPSAARRRRRRRAP
jgi:hypothetical protein